MSLFMRRVPDTRSLGVWHRYSHMRADLEPSEPVTVCGRTIPDLGLEWTRTAPDELGLCEQCERFHNARSRATTAPKRLGKIPVGKA